MLAEMRPSEFWRWMALMSVEPWGAARDDLRSAFVAASLAPAWLKKKDGQPFRAADFMPDFDPPQESDPATLAKRFRLLFGSPPPKKR
jgi:hypothetical protein